MSPILSRQLSRLNVVLATTFRAILQLNVLRVDNGMEQYHSVQVCKSLAMTSKNALRLNQSFTWKEVQNTSVIGETRLVDKTPF